VPDDQIEWFAMLAFHRRQRKSTDVEQNSGHPRLGVS
jgi:hypothetical protein